MMANVFAYINIRHADCISYYTTKNGEVRIQIRQAGRQTLEIPCDSSADAEWMLKDMVACVEYGSGFYLIKRAEKRKDYSEPIK